MNATLLITGGVISLVLVFRRGREVVGGERRVVGGTAVVFAGPPEFVVRSVGVGGSGVLSGFVAILQVFLLWILSGENVDGRTKEAGLLLFPFLDLLVDVDGCERGLVLIGNGALGARYALRIRECGEGFVRNGSGMGGPRDCIDARSKGETETGVGRCGGRDGRGLFC